MAWPENLAVASSLSAEHGFAWEHSLAWCQSHDVRHCQLYLGPALANDPAARRACREAFQAADTAIICHAPGLFRPQDLEPPLLAALADLLAAQIRPTIVVHHDNTVSPRESLGLVQRCNAAGLTVAFENFYRDYQPAALDQTLADWSTICRLGTAEGLDLLPLLDIPRLWLDRFQQVRPPLPALLGLLDSLGPDSPPLYLHLINGLDSSFSRPSWSSLDRGLVPWPEIFGQLRQRRIKLGLAVLEYESEELCHASLDSLAALLEQA